MAALHASNNVQTLSILVSGFDMEMMAHIGLALARRGTRLALHCHGDFARACKIAARLAQMQSVVLPLYSDPETNALSAGGVVSRVIGDFGRLDAVIASDCQLGLPQVLQLASEAGPFLRKSVPYGKFVYFPQQPVASDIGDQITLAWAKYGRRVRLKIIQSPNASPAASPRFTDQLAKVMQSIIFDNSGMEPSASNVLYPTNGL